MADHLVYTDKLRENKYEAYEDYKMSVFMLFSDSCSNNLKIFQELFLETAAQLALREYLQRTGNVGLGDNNAN